MYCVKCGKEIKVNAKFCVNCGQPISSDETEILNENNDVCQQESQNTEILEDTISHQEEKINNISENYIEAHEEGNIDDLKNNEQTEFYQKNRIIDNVIFNKLKEIPKKTVAITAAVLVMVILGAVLIMNPFKGTKAMVKEIDSTVASFDEYILDNYKSEYDDVKSRSSVQKQEQNYDKTKILLTDVKNLKEKLQKDNNTIIDNMLKETKEKDTAKAYPDELETMKGYEEKLTAYKNENKFISAKTVLNQWNDLLGKINISKDNYNVSVNQIDFSNFPKIKVYLSIEDKSTNEVPKNIDSRFFYVSEKNANNNDYLKQTIEKVTQLDQQENLNINMVSDVSASMNGDPLGKAKSIMTNFLNQVQFNTKDKVELTSFSNGVRTCAAFTDNKELLKNEISNLQTYEQTALYDALFASVNTTALQSGAKCVMAFTDGQDNLSKVTPGEVIQVAKRYNVPIFIIGIGSGLDTWNLENISKSTNGVYKQINNISDMSNLYQSIYKKNKEMYLLEYETQEKNNTIDERNIKIDVQTRKDGGGTSYAFTPRLLVSNQSDLNSSDAVAELIGNCLRNYIKAINNHDYSYVQDYIAPGGSVEAQVKPYIMRDIQEKLLSHEIVNKEFKDADTCIVTTRETYEIQNHEEPLHMRVLEGKYEVKKQSDGKWRLLNYADTYKILSKTY